MLVVIDGLGRPLFDRAVAEGRAPTIAALVAQGTEHSPAVSCFPSLTPVCLSAIATGARPRRDAHPGPAAGTTAARGASSSTARRSRRRWSRAPRVGRRLDDEPQPRCTSRRKLPTVFELGRGRRATSRARSTSSSGAVGCATPLKRPARARFARRTGFFDAAYGPTPVLLRRALRLRRAPARPRNLGVHGAQRRRTRRRSAAGWSRATASTSCSSTCPRPTWRSTAAAPTRRSTRSRGPTTRSATLMSAAGGLEPFLERYAVILSPTTASARCDDDHRAATAFADLRLFLARGRTEPADSADRGGGVEPRGHDLPPDRRAAGSTCSPRACRAARRRSTWSACREDEWSVVRRDGRELRFRRDADGDPDRRGNRWRLAGEPGALGAGADRRRPRLRGVPERARAPLSRSCSASTRARSSISAARGVEFPDAGGSHHLGGGSHGSLGAEESLVPLVTVGVDGVSLPDQPSITDVYGLVAQHFGL